MKHTTLALASTLLSLCSPINCALILRQSSTPNVEDIKTAVNDWRADTGIVSNFLNQAGARSYANNAAFHAGAMDAYNAELDELTHKAVLDNELPSSSQLTQANATLVADGTFQSVVDLLEDLTNAHYGQMKRIRQDVKMINFGHDGIRGRCKAVLPAIDMYFQQASNEVENLDGDTSLEGLQAIRPTACGSSS